MNIFMKFGQIQGDATQMLLSLTGLMRTSGQGTGWIPLESFTWGLTSSITTKAGAPGAPNRGPKNPKLDPITVAKDVDLSSIALLNTLCTDEKGQDCTIVFVRTGDPGEIYLQYDLKNTLITNVKVNAKGESAGRPDETLTLAFTEITMHVWQLGEANDTVGSDHITIQNGATDGASPSPPGGIGFGNRPHH